jgi:hypothetical protein
LPHGVTSQKMILFITTVVKTSNLTKTALYVYGELSVKTNI